MHVLPYPTTHGRTFQLEICIFQAVITSGVCIYKKGSWASITFIIHLSPVWMQLGFCDAVEQHMHGGKWCHFPSLPIVCLTELCQRCSTSEVWRGGCVYYHGSDTLFFIDSPSSPVLRAGLPMTLLHFAWCIVSPSSIPQKNKQKKTVHPGALVAHTFQL